jgi:hypothetical protein
MKGGGILSFLLIAIIGFEFILADEKCEVISNHTINGIEYRECKDGRLMKVMKIEELKENGKSESDDINLSEVGVISGDEEFLKDLSKSPKKDEKFDNHFGKQREIREKVHSLQESLKKKKNESAAKNHGRKFGVIYKHNGFDEGSNSRHYESDEESDEEMEDETVEKDAMIKATVAETETTMSSLSLGDGINDTPEGVDVKEMIARAHHKDYHKNPKPTNVDSESAKSEHPAATHQPHDPMHFGNLRFLDFAPETTNKPKSDTPTPESDSDSDSEESESLLLPETPNQQKQQQLPPNPYFLALANNPIEIPTVQQSNQKQNESGFYDIRRDIPVSNYNRRHDDSTATYYTIIKPQILLAFLAPITAFLIYLTVVCFYMYRKKSSSQRKLLPTKNCRYQHFNEDAEATVGFAV